ncbi:MAG: Fur family transcriptional regulator [Actinomycetota bacterium]
MSRSRHVVGTDVHDRVGSMLKARTQRYTALRRQLVDVLGSAPDPVTIAELQRSVKGVALSSLYRNLVILEECHVVSRIMVNNGSAIFELSEELSEHHHHMVCATCGTVRDIVVPESIESGLDRQLSKIARKEGFTFRHHQLDVIGVCGRCS